MHFANGTIAALVGVTLAQAASTSAAQATVDAENRYPSVGVLMVWRVDTAGRPVELRGFASGTLIRDRAMVTAGHFTAPATSMGALPPSIRMVASFSPTNPRDPATWIPVVRFATHPSMPHCPPPPQCDPTDDSLVAPLQTGIADVGLVVLAHAPPGITPARLAEPGALDRAEGTTTTIAGYGTTTPRRRDAPPDTTRWDGKRRMRTSTVRMPRKASQASSPPTQIPSCLTPAQRVRQCSSRTTTAPMSRSEWPAQYLVNASTVMSTPQSNGRAMHGDA